MKSHRFHFVLALTFVCVSLFAQNQSSSARWPAASRETKPWSRWWWHGSALTKEGITKEMEAYQKAGLGGLEITPIYGVYGTEKQFVNYLSPEWMSLLAHTLKEAERLDMGIDMATGTGWPFGGPWVADEDACRNIEYKTYSLNGGGKLKEKIFFLQLPYVRAVGNQIYEVHDGTIPGEQATGTLKEPLMGRGGQIDIKQLVQPVAANKNLQALALDQVKFEKFLPLQTLMAYSDQGKIIDLKGYVDMEGMLQWVAPKGKWKLYAVFAGWHGKMVERAGPGGEGNVIDHFSAEALKNYLRKFDDAFKTYELKTLRSFFNDSYEVDDARGAADFTPALFDEFKKRRGYDLKENLPALFGHDNEEKNQRVLCDYRETISELVLENFTSPWKTWAHGHDAVIRNQAHGSPSNILDLYATVDIPEIEGVEPLRIKMASSAGNVTGKKLISSESATWLNEHFESNLSDIKNAVDRFMLNGINHIFYHGTSYSPPGEAWPGWLFYAAVHLNPRNSLWPHFSTLNKYVERAQSFLQSSDPDNDVLLYYPIYDRFSTPGSEMIEHFDGVGAQFDNTEFKRIAETMLERGYAFDYISDRQIMRTNVKDLGLTTEGNATYKTLVVPHCKYIPVATLTKIVSMAEEGATVLFVGGLPADVSGYGNLTENKVEFLKLVQKLKSVQGSGSFGKGRVFIGPDAETLLELAAIRREKMVDSGVQFLRKKSGEGNTLYFIANKNSAFEGWVTFAATGTAAVFSNPMTGETGLARARRSGESMEVFVQLKPEETAFIEIVKGKPAIGDLTYLSPVGRPLIINGPWSLTFNDGGPVLPPSLTLATPGLWTAVKDSLYSSFSGMATYKATFVKPTVKCDYWLLDLGGVKESVEVLVNGRSAGVMLGPAFEVVIKDEWLEKQNTLEVRVCNLMANRIAYLDRNSIFWKKFYNVNFPARKAENRRGNLFDASKWKAHPSGMMGPVKLIACQMTAK